MENINLYCTVCPNECNLNIVLEGKEIKEVTGNSCKRGVEYANMELTNPQRMLTSTIHISNGTQELLPVRSEAPILREMLLKAMGEINKISLTAPIKIGDVIIKNILGTGVNILASRSIERL